MTELVAGLIVGVGIGFVGGVVYAKKRVERALQDVLVKLLEVKEPDARN